MIQGKRTLIYLLLPLLIFFAHSTISAEKPTVNLVVGQYETNDTGTYLWAGIKLDLPVGWKTYWKWSQEVGKPLTIQWDKSSNVKNIEILWPTPEEITALGYQIYGYHESLVFPLKIQLNDKEQPVQLNLESNILLCDESTCNDTHNNFTFDSLKDNITPNNTKLIQAYVEKTPASKDVLTLNNIETNLSSDKNQYFYNITLKNTSFDPSLKAFLIPDESLKLSGFSIVSYEGPQKTRVSIPLSFEDNNAIKNHALKFNVVLSGKNINVEFNENKVFDAEKNSIFKIASILLFGFIGGIILTFMPCVLPILMLKLLDVLNANSSDVMESRASYAISALGVMFSFLLFAGITILVSHLGHVATWGMHYQNPIFIFIMTAVMIILACNLFGFYEISLPTFLFLTNELKGNIGHFINGIVMTFLAIPCSAPFLGTAASYGLSQPPLISLLVFLSIGLGFSLPYWLLAISPHLLKKVLPRPGKWMVTLKHVAGYVLIAVAIWLLWILSSMISPRDEALICLFFASLMLIIFAIRHKPEWIKNSAWVGVVVCLGFLGTNLHGEEQAVNLNGSADSHWVSFEPNKIQTYLENDKIVFIDFTAKWCITCKFNENVVLKNKEVQAALQQPNVVAMKADWTNPNLGITKFLKNYNQYAIPCYIVFSSKYPQGKVLNTILTKDEVLSNLQI